MDRNIEKIFKNSYCIGAHYKRFKILLVTEGGSDFSGATSENTAAFREHMHRFQWILDAFEAAAKELGLSLGRIDRAEFFTSYNYYWCNTRRFEIHSDERIDPKNYLTRLIENLDAGLVLSIAGSCHGLFERNYELDEVRFLDRPILLEVPRLEDRDNVLKEIFKIYLKNFGFGMDAVCGRIDEEIAKGKSPLDIIEEIDGTYDVSNNSGGGGGFNTYPMGSPSKLYPELLVVCEDPMELANAIFHSRYHRSFGDIGAFNYIAEWCHDTEGMFPKRRVVLYTDKWTTEAYKCYENLFRRFAKKGAVKFDFRLYMSRAVPTKIKLPF